MVTFSIGPKFFYENEDGMAPYVGFGLIGSWIHTTDGSIYLPANTNRGSAGIVGKFGVRYSFFESLVLDFFFDASFQPVATEYGAAIAKKNINLGGYKAGLGIQTFF
jgi:outer membrane protein W